MESTQNRIGATPISKLPRADTLIWTAFPTALAAALVLMCMVAKRQLKSME